jgi:hypothetical protein
LIREKRDERFELFEGEEEGKKKSESLDVMFKKKGTEKVPKMA